MKTCALLLSLLLMLVGCPAWAEDEIVTGPDRRNEIDRRIEELVAERAKISMTGPKVATFLGLALTVAGGLTVAATVGGCQNRDQDGEDCAFGALMAGAGIAGVGIISALGGGAVWGVRAHQRNKIDAELEPLIDEPRPRGLKATLSRLELRSPYRDGAQFVTLGVRF